MRFALSMALSLLLASFPAYAQSASCNINLFKKWQNFSLSRVSTYAFVQQLNNQLSESGRSQIGAILPVANVPISINGSQARDIASSFSKQTGIALNQDTSMSMLISGLSDQSVEAYRICVDGQQVSGPRIFVFDATPTEANVRIRWIAPTGAPTTAKAYIQQVGGNPSAPWPTSWNSGQDFMRIYRRTPGQDLRVIADIGGKSDGTTVPYVPQIEVTLVRKPMRINPPKLETDQWGHNQGPIKDCVSPTFGSVIDPGSVKMTIDAWGGPLNGTSYARVDTKQPDKICWSEFLRPLIGGHGGVILFHIDYTQITPTYRAIPPTGAR